MKRTLLILALSAVVTMPAMATEAMARANNCMACHAIDRKMVGPSFRDISARYATDAGAAARMVTKIQRGGSGAWGPIPMPANPRISDADARVLAAWSLSFR